MPSLSPPAEGSSQRTPLPMRARLSAMFFLQYAALGVWQVTVWAYLDANTGDQGSGLFSTRAIGFCLASGAVGSLVAPAVFGWIADRFYAAERLLAGLHALAAVTLWLMWSSDTEWEFLASYTVYFHLYVPTISLTNTIALRHLRDVGQEFPSVRVFATISWIAACWFVSFWSLISGQNIEPTATPLLLGVVAELAMAAYSLTLPHTPPSTAAVEYGDASQRRGLWRNTPFFLFLVVTVFACAPSQAYNMLNAFLNQEGYDYAAGKQTLGQVSEIFCMLLMPALLARFGLKGLFVMGVVIWVVRFVLLGFGAWGWVWAVYLAIAVHGPSYAFVYVAGQLYVDQLVPASQRGVAQGWHTVASSGLGHLLGAFAVSQAQVVFLTPPGVSPPPYRWFEFWLVPAAVSAVAAVLAIVLIRGAGVRPKPEVHAVDAPPPADALADPPHE